MSITTILLYIIYSIILFTALEVLTNKYKISKLNYIILSLIYLILISGLTNTSTTNIFLVIIIELLIRIFYITNIQEQNFFKIHLDLLITYLITIFLSYILNIHFINKVENILPSANEFKIIIWICIIIYTYTELKNNIKKEINIDKYINKEKQIKYKKEYIITEYAKYKNEYYNMINTKNKEIELIIYSIMIYENYKKSKSRRKIDNILFKLTKKEMKLGIMQVSTKKFITDEENIKIVKKKKKKIYNNIKKTKTKNTEIEVLKEYNKDNYEKIINIYKEIKEFNQK